MKDGKSDCETIVERQRTSLWVLTYDFCFHGMALSKLETIMFGAKLL